VLHVLLGPIGYFIVADDMQHPERWGTFYRNPSFFFPFFILAEIWMWGVAIYCAAMERGHEEDAKVLNDVLRLYDAGEHEIATVLYEEWLRTAGQKQGRNSS